MMSFTEVSHSLWKAVAVVFVLCLLSAKTESAFSEVETCCAIQRACDGCNSVYKVNSITYCCPNCTGSVLVTALICTCTIAIDDPREMPKCTIRNKVVGDYYYGLTSWKTGGNMSKVSTPLVLIGLVLVQLTKYWSRHCG